MNKLVSRAVKTYDVGVRVAPKCRSLSVMRGYDRPGGSFYLNKHAYSPLGVENVSQPKGKVFVARKLADGSNR